MAFSTQEDEWLIKLVARHPALFDNRIPEYKDFTVREDNWKQISHAMRKPTEDCKRRWKHIRDSYNRCKRKRIIDGTGKLAPSKHPKWMLMDKLQFLEKIHTNRVPSRRRVSKAAKNKDEDVLSDGYSYMVKPEDIDRITTISSMDTHFEGNDTSASTSRMRKQDLQAADPSSIQYWTDQISSLEDDQRQEDDDGTNSFCDHIGTILNKLNPALRVEAKTKIFNILMEYELKCLNPDR